MYFSVITPSEHLLRRAAYELAKSSYDVHQWVWKFFPSSADQRRDFIFRRYEQEQIPRFYMVSERQPTAFSEAWQVKSRPYAPRLKESKVLSFQLHASPVVGQQNAAGKSRRHDVVMEA